MAHKKSAGSTSLGRDSQPKYLGVKIPDGKFARSGNIIVRQRGTPIFPGKNVMRAKDDTLVALKDGIIKFTNHKAKRFNGDLKLRTYANVIPQTVK